MVGVSFGEYNPNRLPVFPPTQGVGADAVATEAELLDTLSAREFEIFRLLATGRTPAQCAADLHLSPKTVANQQTAIKEKLRVSTTAALAHLAIRHKVIAMPEL